MSLYSWLSGVPEGALHYNTERDLSNPQYVDWRPLPPMALFMTEIDEDKIRAYIAEVLDEKHQEQLDEIVEKVIKRIKQGESVDLENII